MKPSLRLTTVAVVILASLLLAAAVQIGARLGQIASYDRSRSALQLVMSLRNLKAARHAVDIDVAPMTLRAEIAAVGAAMDQVAAAAGAGADTPFDTPAWRTVRDGWRDARTPADVRRLAGPTDALLRDALLRIAQAAVSTGSRDGLNAPLGESALLALPALIVQESHLADDVAGRRVLERDSPDPRQPLDVAERSARAGVIGSVAFLPIERSTGDGALPSAIGSEAVGAQAASQTFLDAIERSLRGGTIARDHAALAVDGRRAVDRLDALETRLLPYIDDRLAAARARAISEILLTVLLVAAVTGIVAFLTRQAVRSQSRSLVSREALQHQALHDSLTGLPNRRAFADAISRVVAEWTPINDRTTWVLSIDLDYFKEVNDRYGHQTGDQFLIAATERLRSATSADDLVARVGGDEFAVLVRHYDPDSSHASDVAERICAAFNDPIEVQGVRHRLAASVGVVAVDSLHETVDSLLRDADIAMYRAKEDGGDRVVVFDDTLRQAIVHRAELAAELPKALRAGGIGVVFQPILSLRDARCYGFEALVRWRHPVHGLVDAGLLIDVAQDARLIDELGRHIVQEVCRHLAAWRDGGVDLATLSIHFNISPMEAVHADTFGSIAQALETYDIPPRTLVVELTETASMDSVDAANLFLSLLHAIDVRICLDDFGTGYSSLRHLNDFHVDAIKIDRSFVVSAAEDPAKIPIIAGIIALAKGLNAEVIAEGIETSDQLAIIERLGCELVQGYLFAKPLAPADALAFAQRGAVLAR
jgi:diguanylate cyclase (GGDEF)-like protein